MLKSCLVVTALITFMVGFTAADISGRQNVTANAQPADDEPAKKVDAFLSQLDKNDMPGCAVGVVRDGRLVYKRGLGMANLDYGVPNTPSTLFNLASMSKQFTAMSIALLARQGNCRPATTSAIMSPSCPNTTTRSRSAI